MAAINTYKDLLVWQKAMDIAVEVYSLSAKHFPKEEQFGLTSQVRRAANSISLNIAEGYAKHTTKNYVNHLNIAGASNNELESGFLLAIRLGFVTLDKTKKLFSMIEEESKMLNAMINKLAKKVNR